MVDSKTQAGEIRRIGAVSLFVLSTCIILIAAWQAFSHFSHDLEQEIGENLLAITKLKKAIVESHIAERVGDAAVFASRRSVHRLLDPSGSAAQRAEGRQQVVEDMGEMTRAYGYEHILVFDRTLKTPMPGMVSDLPAGPTRMVSAVIDGAAPVVVDLFSKDDGRISYGVVHSVPGGEGAKRNLGAVFMEVDVRKQLLPMLVHWPTESRTGEAFLVRYEGGRVLQIGGNPKLHTPAVQEHAVPNDPRRIGIMLQKGVLGIVLDAIDYRGQHVIMAAARIENTPWFLVSKIDRDEAEESLSDLTWIISALAAIFVLLAGALSWMAWKISVQQNAARQKALTRQYASVLETSIDGFLKMALDGRILDANQIIFEMIGYDREELVGKGIDEIDAKFNRDEVRAVLQDMQSAGRARFQTRLRHKDGHAIDIDVNGLFVEDEQCFYSAIRDISESLEITRRLQRFNRFYVFLSQLTEPLFKLREPGEILQTVCRAAVSNGQFVLVWGGTADPDTGEIRISVVEGAAAGYAEGLKVSTNASESAGQGAAGIAWREQRIVAINDFQNDPRSALWHERARTHNIQAAAVVPVIVGGRTVAEFDFYASDTTYFDAEMLTLLAETARNVSLAWEAGEVMRQRDGERDLRLQISNRFQRIFDSSPVAKQIHSVTDGRLLAINRAHEMTFGYRLEEIAGEDGWFDKVYLDQKFRGEMKAFWLSDMHKSRDNGIIVHSPEMRLHCKDGTTRIVQGAMAVTGDDAIVTWTDLTAVRRGEQALRESERRFRSMVEETVTGFYAVRDNKLIYVNPRMTEMMGWSAEEVLGRDPMDFVEPESREDVLEGRAKFASGQRNVAYNLRLHRKDGRIIVLGVHASIARWDDQPALVAMVEDITERANAEARINEYTHRLEASMRGTLEAVARMVDLRDPYTAGHERRVGLIASAIAREMGWSEDRAKGLELIGLVHDIGKIAVPAEILSKPTRLTPTEYSLIKGHAEAGYEILKDVVFEQPVAEIIRQHHERLDGSGYPQGLKDGQILPEARILAVSDVLESMASHRPYRPALGVDAALAELERNRGTLYDADVVDALLRLIHDKAYVIPA